MSAPRVWGIHGGKTGDAFTLFTQGNVVALGWEQMPDLRTLENSPQVYREAVARHHPHIKQGGVPVAAGQLRRFVHDLQVGEIVVFAAKQDWTFRLGRVSGEYFYTSRDDPYPHQRPVEWLKTIKRDEVSQAARFEMGSAMSFFRVKTHAAEFLAHLGLGTGGVVDGETDEAAEGEPETEAETILTAGQVEEATREFFLERLRTVYAGHALEEFVGDLLRAMGYRSEVTQKSGDHGVDVIAGRGALGLDPPILKVQVKSGAGNVGEPDLLKLNGAIEQNQGERGIVISLGGFTPQALRWAQGKQWFQLIGPGELVDLALEHYEALSPEHREKLPLRPVLAPDVPGGAAT